MAKQHLVIDAWIREAQEAERLVREIYDKVMSKNLEKQQGQKQKQQQRRVDEDLESRWKMLSDLKLRTRALAVSLNAMPVPTLNRQGGLSAADILGQMKASFPSNESEMLKTLVYSEETTQSHVQVNGHSSYISTSLLWKVCRTICIILGASTFLFLLAILCAVM